MTFDLLPVIADGATTEGASTTLLALASLLCNGIFALLKVREESRAKLQDAEIAANGAKIEALTKDLGLAKVELAEARGEAAASRKKHDECMAKTADLQVEVAVLRDRVTRTEVRQQ